MYLPYLKIHHGNGKLIYEDLNGQARLFLSEFLSKSMFLVSLLNFGIALTKKIFMNIILKRTLQKIWYVSIYFACPSSRLCNITALSSFISLNLYRISFWSDLWVSLNVKGVNSSSSFLLKSVDFNLQSKTYRMNGVFLTFSINLIITILTTIHDWNDRKTY